MQPSQHPPNPTLLQLLYLLHQKSPLRPEVHCLLLTLNYLLILLLYLQLSAFTSSPSIITLSNQVAIYCMLGGVAVLGVQVGVAVMYGRHVFLKGQYLVYRGLVYPLALACFVGLDLQEVVRNVVLVGVGVGMLGLELLLGRERYGRNLLVQRTFTTTSYLLVMQMGVALFRVQSADARVLVAVLMAILASATRLIVIEDKLRKSNCLQFTLIKCHATTYIIYSVFILYKQVLVPQTTKYQPAAFIVALVVMSGMAEFFQAYSDQMQPLSANFFNSTDNPQNFLQTVQYLMDDMLMLQSTENLQIHSTSLIPFHYEHVRNCRKLDCPLSHELVPQILSSQGRYKMLCGAVFRIAEQLFQNYVLIKNDSLDLKFAFIKFYLKVGSNKLKIMQLIADIEKKELSFYQRIQLYTIKRYISDVDVAEFIESIKIEDTSVNFNQNMSSLMRLLIEFWSQFLQQRVDFQKLLKLKQKLTPAMQAIESQVEQSLVVENFSTILIMKVYAEYCRVVMNNEMKSSMISDYVSLLGKKISEVHQLNSLSADMEIGLIAISLNVKKLGEIKMANNQAANIFNYSKQEFININVNTLMPEIFSKYHDDFLKAFLVNEHKKVNIDRRLVLGKKKQGYIFEIYLQLQKSLLTSSDQLIFIANIEVVKVQEAHILLVCDDRGTITDTNSAYREIFVKSLKRKRNSEPKTYANIQELIPNFFEIVMNNENQTKTSTECYDNPVYGVLEFRFEISKVSFKQTALAGYTVKGVRLSEPKEPIFKNSHSLSKTLLELAEERDLKGIKVQYNPNENVYYFCSRLDVFGFGQFQSEFTIPYTKLDIFSKILNQQFENKPPVQYDADIKTLRFCRDHFERVEEPESFESEIDQEEKTTINNRKFGIIKQKLLNEQNYFQRKTPQVVVIAFSILSVVLMLAFYFKINQEKQGQFKQTQGIVQAYSFRSKLSEYIFYFQAEKDAVYGDFFKESKDRLKVQLIQQISRTDLPQSQKQRALKVVYLEQTLKTTSLAELVNDETLSLAEVIYKANQTAFTIFKFVLGVLIILKLVINILTLRWHQRKLVSIFSLFLSLPEPDIKKSHRKSVQFVRDLSATNLTEQKSSPYDQQQQQSDQENPHIKIKRFKNETLNNTTANFIKLNIFNLLTLTIFIAILINDWDRTNRLQVKQQTYEFISSVMPEYSTYLMRTYSHKIGGVELAVREQFAKKCQYIDYKMANLAFSNISNNYLHLLFDNVCESEPLPSLPLNLTCLSVRRGVLADGISKAINLLLTRLADISLHAPTAATAPQLHQLSLLLYSLVQPILASIQLNEQEKIIEENHYIRVEILIYFVFLVLVQLGDAVYSVQYPLEGISTSVRDSKVLVQLMPDFGAGVAKNGYVRL